MQLILIVPSMSKRVDIRKIKAEIIRYVGTRLTVDDTDLYELPGVVIKEPLPSEDKDYISKLIEDGVIVFIEFPHDGDDDLNYLDAISKQMLI